MANFRPIKTHGTGLERWKDEKTGKGWWRTGWLIPRKIGKRGKTRSKKEKKRKKRERERSFLNGNAFLSFPVPTDFDQRTSLLCTRSLGIPYKQRRCWELTWKSVVRVRSLPSNRPKGGRQAYRATSFEGSEGLSALRANLLPVAGRGWAGLPNSQSL